MGEVIDMNRERDSRDPMVQIRAALERDGHCQVPIAELTVSIAEWRKYARAAGRDLRRPIQTVAGEDMVYASLRDWPRDETEKARHDAAMRSAMEEVGKALFPEGYVGTTPSRHLRIVPEE
jgi:hypothetical protein